MAVQTLEMVVRTLEMIAARCRPLSRPFRLTLIGGGRYDRLIPAQEQARRRLARTGLTRCINPVAGMGFTRADKYQQCTFC
jgi:hypothetical protein